MNIKGLYRSIEKNEWKFILLVIFASIALTSLGHLYNWAAQGEKQYLGYGILSTDDFQFYYADIQQIKDGNYLLKDLYTSEVQTSGHLNIFWLPVGLAAKYLDLSPQAIFHITRVLFIPLFLIIAYLFGAYFFTDKFKRKLFYILFVFASGFGGFLYPLVNQLSFNFDHSKTPGYFHYPPDLWMAESNTFLTMYFSPHLMASLGLILAIIVLMLMSFENDKKRYSLAAGILAMILFQFHPYHVPLVFGLMGIYFIAISIKRGSIQKIFIKHGLILGIASLPSILYWLYITKVDLIATQISRQNDCITPAFFMVFIGYGGMFIFSALGVYLLKKNGTIKEDRHIFFLLWLALQMILIYFPVNFQRRMIEGMQIPLAFFSTFGVAYVYETIKKRGWMELKIQTIGAIWIFFLFFSLSHIVVLSVEMVTQQKERSDPHSMMYLSKDDSEALKWTRDNVKNGEVILTGLKQGNLVPGQTGKTVYIGHWSATNFLKMKLLLSDRFFEGKFSEKEVEEFTKENNIKYLLLTDRDEESKKFDPAGKEYLKEVFRSGTAAIYKIF